MELSDRDKGIRICNINSIDLGRLDNGLLFQEDLKGILEDFKDFLSMDGQLGLRTVERYLLR